MSIIIIPIAYITTQWHWIWGASAHDYKTTTAAANFAFLLVGWVQLQ